MGGWANNGLSVDLWDGTGSIVPTSTPRPWRPIQVGPPLPGVPQIADTRIPPTATPREPAGSPTPTPTRRPQDASFEIAIAEPIPLDQPVPITITVHFNRDLSGTTLTLAGYNSMKILGQKAWALSDAHAGQTVQVTSQILFPYESTYSIGAGIYVPKGGFVGKTMRVDVHGGLGAIMPTPTPLSDPSARTHAPAQAGNRHPLAHPAAEIGSTG